MHCHPCPLFPRLSPRYLPLSPFPACLPYLSPFSSILPPCPRVPRVPLSPCALNSVFLWRALPRVLCLSLIGAVVQTLHRKSKCYWYYYTSYLGANPLVWIFMGAAIPRLFFSGFLLSPPIKRSHCIFGCSSQLEDITSGCHSLHAALR